MKLYITKDSDGDVSIFTHKPKRVESDESPDYVYYRAQGSEEFIDRNLFSIIDKGGCIETEIELPVPQPIGSGNRKMLALKYVAEWVDNMSPFELRHHSKENSTIGRLSAAKIMCLDKISELESRQG